jgi:hypothetical protein
MDPAVSDKKVIASFAYGWVCESLSWRVEEMKNFARANRDEDLGMTSASWPSATARPE